PWPKLSQANAGMITDHRLPFVSPGAAAEQLRLLENLVGELTGLTAFFASRAGSRLSPHRTLTPRVWPRHAQGDSQPAASAANRTDATRPHLWLACNTTTTFKHSRRSPLMAPRFGHIIQSHRGPL